MSYRYKRNYWSRSKFADWFRGIAKPKAGTSDEWNTWEKNAKTNHPIRFWISENLLNKVQSIISYPIDNLYEIKYYINNRWVTKTHCLMSHPRDIPRGKWADVTTRLLVCPFNELVNFVEIEVAAWHVAWADDADRKKYKMPFWAIDWFKWRVWRCPQAGIDNLTWQTTLTDSSPNQAEAAKEILALYHWWTVIYRNRPDPMYASGWSSFSARRRVNNNFSYNNLSDQEKEEFSKITNKCHEIEEQYLAEEQEMLIRLIKVKNYLWT